MSTKICTTHPSKPAHSVFTDTCHADCWTVNMRFIPDLWPSIIDSYSILLQSDLPILPRWTHSTGKNFSIIKIHITMAISAIAYKHTNIQYYIRNLIFFIIKVLYEGRSHTQTHKATISSLGRFGVFTDAEGDVNTVVVICVVVKLRYNSSKSSTWRLNWKSGLALRRMQWYSFNGPASEIDR